jgi:hypothetical protein
MKSRRDVREGPKGGSEFDEIPGNRASKTSEAPKDPSVFLGRAGKQGRLSWSEERAGKRATLVSPASMTRSPPWSGPGVDVQKPTWRGASL